MMKLVLYLALLGFVGLVIAGPEITESPTESPMEATASPVGETESPIKNTADVGHGGYFSVF